jgi:arsenical pump membrane protein
VSGALALILALVLLGLTLSAAMAREPRLPEALVAVLGAVSVVVTGGLSVRQAGDALRELGPTVGFLAALLLIAEGCRRAGLFEAIGDLIADRCQRRPRRLLGLVFLVARAVTIVLGLDATAVLLPPVLWPRSRLRRGVAPRPVPCHGSP